MPTAHVQVTGVIVALGTGFPLEDGSELPMDLEVGDRVLFEKNMGTAMRNGEESVVLLRYGHIQAVIQAHTEVEFIGPPKPPMPEGYSAPAPQEQDPDSLPDFQV